MPVIKTQQEDSMEIYALTAFAITALGGIYMALKILKGSSPPWVVSLLHAGIGAGGILLLCAAYMKGAGAMLTPLALLIIAALGGFFLASFHVRKKLPPKAVLGVHALVAVLGVVLLAKLILI